MCTGISYESTDNQEFFGRTQEYNLEYDYVLAQFPRDYVVDISASKWKTKYSVIGVSARIDHQLMPTVLDGLNEFGLACSTQYFAEDNIYNTMDEIIEEGKSPVYAEQFIFYILSMCKDIDDVKQILKSVAIPNSSIVQKTGLPQHFFIKDGSGRSIVVEPSIAAEFGFNVYENKIGVMTNSPSFDWQVTNLKNYTGLTTKFQNDLQLNNTTIKSLGKSSGLIGLPGDYTAPSRFVKATTLLNFSEKTDSNNSINLGFHILSMSDIPKGVVICADGTSEYTQYTSLYNQTKRELYIKLYDNLDVQKITFSDEYANNSEPKIYELVKESHYKELK
ncbi:choloylglycine hydrolase family protein [Companilactobacillus allii]|uniref:Choloylglycine hydrolase/NAAA C-terminal domain-containing protein n=1 Tax=Companilactobacillus allii TaxID=1847728 RepID=A0A1P8Q323_9LACO|nr:choloylglycine hydrolase family protein [Companilactobacillus allii]APX72241.1 hypothetical protein BTM29_06555 [Companilactobacillus allii]USQ69334.1 choloylglycine hydrolase family protein [Companilactobacillus allii]